MNSANYTKSFYWVLGLIQISACMHLKTNRIVGGTETIPHSAPYTAHLDSYYGMFCTGTLIDEEWIMSAAHCLTSSFDVVLGDHNLSEDEGTEQTFSTTLKLIHPSYNDYNQQYDFMMVKLSTKAVINDYVQVMNLPTATVPVSTECTVCGWGYTSGTGANLPDKLQCVKVSIITDEECNISYNGMITDDMVCAADFGQDACNGDSGGPMTCNGELHGVTSWGYGCAFPYYPGVYGRVSSVTQWINYILQYY